MSEWKQYSMQYTGNFYREGWLGVWDAVVSAVTGKQRKTFTGPLTVSFWAKHNSDVSFINMQAEYVND